MSKKLAEANFQGRLKTDLQSEGWHVTKLQSGMGYTVLDLFVGSRQYGPAWIELKTIPSIKTKIPLTMLQRKEMRDHQAVGTVAICLTAMKHEREEYLFLTTNPGDQYVQGNPIAVRTQGGKWRAAPIGNAITLERARLNVR